MRSYTLGPIDLRKIIKGAAIAAAGAVLTYLTGVITHTNFGVVWTPVIYVVWSALVNTLTKILDGQTQ